MKFKPFNYLLLAAAAASLATPGCAKDAPVAAPRHPLGTHTNHLIGEASPYLLEHAHNPVNWYPWGAEALDKAKAENKPIFLSIGYSACHWCHVMEHQSFEDEDIAKILNDNFIAIKVDREQRPDIDSQYMMAYQVMSGGGGWPLNIVLTPDRKPFQGSIYLPADQFTKRITQIAGDWKKKPDQILTQADRVAAAFMKAATVTATGKLPAGAVKQVAEELSKVYDSSHGGFGYGIKFPEEPNLSFLLTVYHQSNDKHQLEIVTNTLDHMIDGGIHDQLGGGFHRYSTDAEWHVPHFEKMLYNQAQLVLVLLDAYRITKNPRYKETVDETLAFVAREMRDTHGGFLSSIDADSEGEEGKFYLWTPADIEAALGEDAAKFEAQYGVTAKGDIGGKSALRVVSGKSGKPDSDTDPFAAMRQTLLAARDKRVRPHTDDKILASWNGLMITACAQAAQTLDEPKYKQMAIDAADFIDKKMTRDGHLLHSFHTDRADVPAQLADYAYLANGQLALYDATQDKQWLTKAQATAGHMVAALWDKSGGAFFSTVPQADLMTQLKAGDDDALQSPNAIAVAVMVRLGVLTNDDAWHDRAVKTLEAFGPAAAKNPSAYATLLAQTVGTSWWPTAGH